VELRRRTAHGALGVLERRKPNSHARGVGRHSAHLRNRFVIRYAESGTSPVELVAYVIATAVGAILAALAVTMICEAFEWHHSLIRLIASLYFLAASTFGPIVD
jgi:hypothetical protein